MRKLLYGFDLNGDMIGAAADLATDDIQFLFAGPGQSLESFDTVVLKIILKSLYGKLATSLDVS